MVNVTIIKGKDILKYIIRVTVVLIIIYILKNILTKSFIENINISSLKDTKLLECLEENIPVSKYINKENENINAENNQQNETVNPLKLVVGMQLNSVNYIKEDEKKDICANSENVPKEQVEQAKTGLPTEVIKNNVPTKYTNTYNGVQVRNETEYLLTEEILTPNITINNKDIIIFHTHTCESYTPSENYNYEQTGTYRTTDNNYNVVRVGEELKKQLNSYNYNVYHDSTYHDYPAYDGSYGRSLITVKEILKEKTDTEIIIDLHRDAIGDYSYAPTVKIGDEEAAQLMFVIGTDGSGLEHENWQQNLKFAIKVQEKADELYPGLFKPIILRNSRYNQHLSKAATIIEVGATGNTMEQCLNSMKYLAKVIDELNLGTE